MVGNFCNFWSFDCFCANARVKGWNYSWKRFVWVFMSSLGLYMTSKSFMRFVDWLMGKLSCAQQWYSRFCSYIYIPMNMICWSAEWTPPLRCWSLIYVVIHNALETDALWDDHVMASLSVHGIPGYVVQITGCNIHAFLSDRNSLTSWSGFLFVFVLVLFVINKNNRR